MNLWIATLLLVLQTPEPPPDRVVYLDSMLKSPTTRMEGFTPFRGVDSTFGNTRVRHGLSTDVAQHASVLARISTVTFSLDKRYATFEALLGRDNEDAALGQSYCFFEIYADGRRVYTSPALRSALSDVVAGGGDSFKVKTPQSVKLDVSGVDALKLVVQLPNFSQKGYRVNRASGCVWGEARVVLKPGASQEIVTVPTAPDQPARTALVKAVTALLKRAPVSASGEAQRVAVTPVQFDPDAPGSPDLRDYVVKLLRRQPASVTRMTFLEPTDDASFLEKFAREPDLATRTSALTAASRNVGADLLLIPSLVSDSGWFVELRLLDSAGGATLASVRVAVEPTKPG